MRTFMIILAIFIVSEFFTTLISAWILWNLRRDSTVAKYVGIFLSTIVLNEVCQFLSNMHRPPHVVYGSQFIGWGIIGRSIFSWGSWFLLLSIVKRRKAEISRVA